MPSKAWSPNTWKVRLVVLFAYLPKSKKDCNLPNQIHPELLKYSIPYRMDWISSHRTTWQEPWYQAYRGKNQRKYPFTLFLRFMTLLLGRIILYRRISRRKVFHSQHFSTWNKVSSACFPKFNRGETCFCSILYAPLRFTQAWYTAQ